jgi:hypothetical protein
MIAVLASWHLDNNQEGGAYTLSKRIKLVLAVVAAMVTMLLVNALPAFAQGQAACGIGAGISEKTLADIAEGNPSGGGQFASHAAQTVEPNFGSLVSSPTAATKCAQK